MKSSVESTFGSDVTYPACKLGWCSPTALGVRAGIASLLITLTACSTPERIVYQKVTVPVYQPCKTDVNTDPTFPLDTGPIATDIAQAVKDLHADRKARQAWTKEASAALKGCKGE